MHINLQKKRQSIVTNYNSASGSSRNSCPTTCKVFNTRHAAFANKILNQMFLKSQWAKPRQSDLQHLDRKLPSWHQKLELELVWLDQDHQPTDHSNQPTNQPFQHLFPNQNSSLFSIDNYPGSKFNLKKWFLFSSILGVEISLGQHVHLSPTTTPTRLSGARVKLPVSSWANNGDVIAFPKDFPGSGACSGWLGVL